MNILNIRVFSFFALSCIILNISNLSAQNTNLYIPIEYQKAIKNKTRTLTGEVGENYWQNKIRYEIDADFNPETGLLKGKEIIIYTNNSPHNIHSVFFNIYSDLYKKGNKRDAAVKITDLHDGTKITSILINDKKNSSNLSKWNYSDTHFKLNLEKGLKTGESVKIELAWEFTMPKSTYIRNGKYAKNTWFVSYWYPQIAVYDDINGWDNIGYDGLHEFYMPFADFDVTIKLPAKQIVWAAGELQNAKDILVAEYYKRYKKAKTSDKIIHIIEKSDLSKKITKGNNDIFWNFKAKNVVDFAFSTSNHYLWDATSLIVDKKTQRRTNIHVAYKQNSHDFHSVADVSKKTLDYLSNTMPAIPYPYPSMTVFNGHGGMEYPMIVNDGSEFSMDRTIFLTSHEITHTYFPFYMGINQERYAWIDEGFTMFLPSEFQTNSGNTNQAESSTSNYEYYAGSSMDMPLMTESFNIKDYQYYIASYYKPEMAYRILEDLLGKELFLKAMQTFIHRWNGKYTSPYDFFFTFNNVANEDLSWFWKPWFFEFGYPDIAIKDVKKSNGSYEISIVKKGNLPVPIYLTIRYADGSNEILKKTARVWKNSNNFIFNHKTKKKITSIKLGNSIIPDINKKDNSYKYYK